MFKFTFNLCFICLPFFPPLLPPWAISFSACDSNRLKDCALRTSHQILNFWYKAWMIIMLIGPG